MKNRNRFTVLLILICIALLPGKQQCSLSAKGLSGMPREGNGAIPVQMGHWEAGLDSIADETTGDSLVYHEESDSVLQLTGDWGVKIIHEVNIIGNAEALEPFFQKLLIARTDGRGMLSVYHIGDSHIAGRAYPQALAAHLHELYGPGKTVVIAPVVKKKAHIRPALRKGKQRRQASKITVKKNRKKVKSPVSRTAKKRSAAVYQRRAISADLALLNSEPLQSSLRPDFFDSDMNVSGPRLLVIDSLNNGGISFNYSAFGVPGKSFKYFADNPTTIQQLKAYRPDLVIISLGVNDIFGKRIDEEYIRTNLERLVGMVREQQPSASILLGLSADAWVKKKKSNPFLPRLKAILIDFAETAHCAYWDPIPVFGGYGCMNQWFRKNLCGKDRIHLTVAGYTLLGKTFAEAIDKAFIGFQRKSQPNSN
jgi:lysophospholipase L1-like esterase